MKGLFMDEPRRMHEDGALPPNLRAALGEARGELPSRQRLVGIAAGLSAAGVPVAVHAAPWALAAKAKLLVAVVVLGGATTGGYLVLRSPTPAPASAKLSASAAVPPGGPVANPITEPAHIETPPASARLPSVRPRKAARPQPRPANDLLEEASLLEQARALLKSRPQEALRILRAHRAQHPQAALAQEADLLLIEASFALHDISGARKHGEAFLRTYPQSPHTRRVRQLLTRQEGAATP